MFFTGSTVVVGDNSGGRVCRSIKSLGRKRIFASLGEVVSVVNRRVYSRKKEKKGSMTKAVIVQGASWFWRESTMIARNFAWCIVLLKRDAYTPKATRIKLPVSFELINTLQLRALLMANYRV
jgi:ribosomal protein L14